MGINIFGRKRPVARDEVVEHPIETPQGPTGPDQPFDLNAYYKEKAAREQRERELAAKSVVRVDPRDRPKFGVESTRPGSTQSRHGVGEGSSVGF